MIHIIIYTYILIYVYITLYSITMCAEGVPEKKEPENFLWLLSAIWAYSVPLLGVLSALLGMLSASKSAWSASKSAQSASKSAPSASKSAPRHVPTKKNQ